jgi:hypothetical protein
MCSLSCQMIEGSWIRIPATEDPDRRCAGVAGSIRLGAHRVVVHDGRLHGMTLRRDARVAILTLADRSPTSVPASSRRPVSNRPTQ